MLVVFAFLGSLRSVIIPVVAIPLSLIGAFIMMLALGFSINLLSLLAMVLAIGLVVDDAIIVVENVHRHINEGAKPSDAALQAARELAGPIIAMTVVLMAAYAPIAFQGGLTGALFIEFAFTLVGTIIISTIVALTLSPMMCAKMLRAHEDQGSGHSSAHRAVHRPEFRRAPPLLQSPASRRAELSARRLCVLRHHRHRHRRTFHDDPPGARAPGGSRVSFRLWPAVIHGIGHAVQGFLQRGL